MRYGQGVFQWYEAVVQRTGMGGYFQVTENTVRKRRKSSY